MAPPAPKGRAGMWAGPHRGPQAPVSTTGRIDFAEITIDFFCSVIIDLMNDTTPAAGFVNYLPDEIDMLNIIAFTLSPNPRWFRGELDPLNQYRMLLCAVFGKEPLMRKAFGQYFFVPELRTDGTVHIHGYYLIGHLEVYSRWFQPAVKRIGLCRFKDKRYKVDYNWMEYCHQDWLEMCNYFDPLPYPIENGVKMNVNWYKKIPAGIPSYFKKNGDKKKRVTRNILKYFLDL